MTCPTAYAAYLAVVALVALQRLAELRVSRRNDARSRALGAVEHGRGHYPFMLALHVAFLAGCVLEVPLLARPFEPELAAPALLLLLAAQALRLWCMKSLGPAWSTRVWAVPGAARITTGPYAYLRHPNYLAVAIEGLALPLLHTAWLTAGLFTLLNAWLLAVRMRCEDRVLPRTDLRVAHRAENA